MVTCPKCATANAPGSTFCIGCGTDLPHDEQAHQQPQSQPAAQTPGWAPPPPPGWNPPPYQQQPYQQQPYQQQPYQQQPYQQQPYQQYQPPQYGQQPYQPAGYAPPRQRIYNYMPLAIVALIAGIFGCAVFAVPGVVSLVFASQVDGKANMGDIQGALRSARTAKVWGIVGLALMAALVAGLGIFAIIGAATSGNGSGSGSF